MGLFNIFKKKDSSDRSRLIVFKEETEITLAQPAKYPTGIVNSLRDLFSHKSDVKAAYLGWIFIPKSGQPPHYIIGLDVDSDLLALTQEAGFLAKKHLGSKDVIDFANIRDGSNISIYLKGTTPFYQKQ